MTAVIEADPHGLVEDRKTVGRRRGRIALAMMVAVAVAVGATLVSRPHPSALERTRSALLQDSRFGNGPKAGITFANASGWLLQDGRSCQRARGASDRRCQVRLAAAAYASVTAFIVAACTAPGVFRARTAMLGYVRSIIDFDHQRLGTRAAPSPPNLATC